MKINFKNTCATFVLSLAMTVGFGQVPDLGASADFVLFSTVGAVTKTGTGFAHLTGNVGTNSGSSTGFGNVDGDMCDGNPQSAAASTDLLLAYGELDAAIATFFPGVLLGNGITLVPGIYGIPAAATLNLELILDGQGDPNALFIFQIDGSFSTNANSKVTLINGAQACNVFWKTEGLVDMATGTTMRGTIVANNAAINMAAGDTLEGRALAINGAVTIDAILGYTPIGCGSPVLVGPFAPPLGATECYAIFSGIGPVTNTGITTVIGDVGANGGLTTGYNPLFVTGTIHPIPDGSTAACSTDLLTAYNFLNAITYDIELLYPAQFGNNLVLTPHTYLMNGAVTFTDTLYLNAQGNPDAVFVFQVNGAFGTSTFSKVILINGTQPENVYWKIDGAVDINDYSIFNGTIISQGALNLFTGVQLNGRAMTVVGAVNTTAIDVIMPLGCGSVSAPLIVTDPVDEFVCSGGAAVFSVSATGTLITYQWRKGSVDLVDGGNISGSSTNTLTINPATVLDVAADYNVIVTGAYSPNDTSVFVELVVGDIPVITTEPVSDTACVGGSANFTVVSSGTGLSYQWRKGLVNLVNGGSVSGATSATLTINPVAYSDAANNYNVVVSSCPPNDTSVNVTLVVDSLVTIITQPADQVACVGGSADFSVVASGTNLTYQWRKGLVNLVNGGSVSGATSDTLVINPVSSSDYAANYNVVVTGSCLPAVTSVNAELLDGGVASIAISNSPVCEHDTLQLSTATIVGATYSWTGPGSFLSNDQNPVILASAEMNEGTYTLVVTGGGCPSTPSDVFVMVYDCDTSEFFIPEGFSPNGDGTNDVFNITGLDNFPGSTIVIFNRWGNKVFEEAPYLNAWDGHTNSGLAIGGDEVPVGTYFYLVDLNDGSDVIKGTVYLNK